jgi:hypothetical protein
MSVGVTRILRALLRITGIAVTNALPRHVG